MRAGVALGSNLGDRLGMLRQARDQIGALPDVVTPILESSVYETDPEECEEDAPKFLNAAIEFEYSGSPENLLGELAKIERSLGRPASRARNKSRLIDLDLLYLGPLEIDTPELQLPHPRLTRREFVLRPLADIRPGLILPGQTEPVNALLESTVKSGSMVHFATEW